MQRQRQPRHAVTRRPDVGQDLLPGPEPQMSAILPTALPLEATALAQGSVHGSAVQPGALAPDRTIFASQANVIPDGGFEQQATRDEAERVGWQTTRDWADREGTWSASKIITDDGTGASLQARHVVRSGVQPVFEGDKFLYSCLIAVVPAAAEVSNGNDPAIGVTWRDSAGAALSESFVEHTVYNGVVATLEGMFTAPAGVASMDVWYEVPAGMVLGPTVHIDALLCRQMLSFRSDLTGARVELDLDGLRLYDAGGVEVVDLDATTGDATFKGDIDGGSLTVIDADASTLVTIKPNEGMRFLRNDGSGDVVGRVTSSWVDLFGDTTYIYVEAQNPKASGAGNPARKASIGLSENWTSPDEIAAVDIHARGAGTNKTVLRLSERTGTGQTSFVQIGREGSSDAQFLLSMEPSNSDLGASKYSRGLVGFFETSTTNAGIGTTAEVVISSSSVTLIKGRRYRFFAYNGGIRLSGAADGQELVKRFYVGAGRVSNQKVPNQRGTSSDDVDGTHQMIYTSTANQTVTIEYRVARADGAGSWSIPASADNMIQVGVEDVSHS